MEIIEEHVTRRDVITYYVEYDRQKKRQPAIENLEAWPWDDPNAIDEHLQSNHLKPGVLSAYRVWQLAQLNYADIADCAIVNHIFPDQPQTLGQIDQGLIAKSRPNGNPEWWGPLSSGSNIPREWALILRPTVASERPAKWYIEDGSGRAIALLQRILMYQEFWRTAWAYIGIIPDEGSHFLQKRSELLG
jgi:hypothetical protein